MNWYQKQLLLAERPQGIHLITDEITSGVQEIGLFRIGFAHLFIQHTSASLAINESVEPEVRADMQSFFEKLVPASTNYTHNYEGPDDMPAHIKSVLTGCELTIPIKEGHLALGTWQGIYLCEHRIRSRSRRILVTLMGEHQS